MKRHLQWLESNGMVCNVEKTEMMIIGCEGGLNIDIGERKIESLGHMKVLGILFDDKLSWKPQVDSVIKKTNRLLHGLKRIRKFLNKSQAKTVITSFYFSVLFWL
jgi:hypothetical protein